MKSHNKFEPKINLQDATEVSYLQLLKELQVLYNKLLDSEKIAPERLLKINSHHHQGAINLIHYLALRRQDMRPLQNDLAAVGLSSLGCAGSHVLQNLRAIITLLERALQLPVNDIDVLENVLVHSGANLLQDNAKNLLGKRPAQRHVRILVTLPADAADDYSLIKDMLTTGMDCARINCAHDNPVVWLRIIEKIKQASRETGLHCRILMDLGGPKLRTGEIAMGPAVMKWSPKRDVMGNVTESVRIWVHNEQDNSSCPVAASVCLPIKGDWLENVKKNDHIEFIDARGSRRRLRLLEDVGNGFWAESSHTVYLKPGIKLHLIRLLNASGHQRQVGKVGVVGDLPRQPESIRLYRGDRLVLTKNQTPGLPEQYDEDGHLISVTSIPCSLPDAFTRVMPGERIMFDDGRIGGVIRKVNAEEIIVEITHARDGGEKLLSDKGINLPDSQLGLSGLTDTDIDNLNFVVQHADMVGLSFVHNASDIELLQKHLKTLNAENLGIVIKIETRKAFENLPELLFSLMHSKNVGVMVARGDLAVECGYERLAELQEEIMWLAEAAHLPLIWATQVLEGLAKDGKPSRAEITDAAMGERAECVMLNKGPHILDAIQMLDDILQRMQGHQQKKRPLLRRLHW
ncbi:MAG: pyruvate kinase [Methylotenera sp.]|nr:pyruvate kinase [Methylotenera sp.]